MSLNSRDQSPNQKVILAYLNDLLSREHGASPGVTSDVSTESTAESPSLSPVILSPSILEEVAPEKTVIDDASADADVTEALAKDDAEPSDYSQPTDYTQEILAPIEEADEYVASEWSDNGRPVWAQEAFDILLFQVNGMTLAVPLIALGQIYEITDALSPLFGQAPWFVGIQPTPMGKIKVVNTARYVMPERYDEHSAQEPEYIMTIDRLQWGLTVNSVDQPIRIPVDGVKWRRERQQQPWMAGIVKEHMCVLIDVPTLGRALLDSDVSS